MKVAMIAVGDGAVTLAVAGISGLIAVVSLGWQLSAEARRASRERKLFDVRTARRYLEPMNLAVSQLQSRLENIENKTFLQRYGATRRDYALQSTMFALAEVLGAIELWRQERQFDDVSPVVDTRELEQRLAEFGNQLATDEMLAPSGRPATLMLWRQEQRAIGELMIDRSVTEHGRCLGYAAFTRRLVDPEFSQWFASLERDLEEAIDDPSSINPRLAGVAAACRSLGASLNAMLAKLADQ